MLWYVVQVRTGEERDIAAKLTDMGFQDVYKRQVQQRLLDCGQPYI